MVNTASLKTRFAVAWLKKRARTWPGYRGIYRMTCNRIAAASVLVVALPLLSLAPSAALAQAGTITKGMQNNCANDYKKFCGDYGLQTAALNLCMKKAGPSLSPACVQALVQAGKITQGAVDKIKAQMKGR